MGLGDTLGPLPVENGGTGSSNGIANADVLIPDADYRGKKKTVTVKKGSLYFFSGANFSESTGFRSTVTVRGNIGKGVSLDVGDSSHSDARKFIVGVAPADFKVCAGGTISGSPCIQVNGNHGVYVSLMSIEGFYL